VNGKRYRKWKTDKAKIGNWEVHFQTFILVNKSFINAMSLKYINLKGHIITGKKRDGLHLTRCYFCTYIQHAQKLARDLRASVKYQKNFAGSYDESTNPLKVKRVKREENYTA
jgi:hypothetical protein